MLYKASDDYKKLADSTKRNWSPWLDRIADYFGELRIAQFDRPEKIRPIIRRWRNQWADKPRTADYGMQVLSRVLSYAVDPLGKIAGNPCEGIKQLYSSDRSEIIWTDADIAQLKKTVRRNRPCGRSGGHTGLRLGDLLRLSWSHVGEDAITHHHRQEQASPRGDHSALRWAPGCAGEHPEARDHDPDQQSAPPVDGRWVRNSSFNTAKIDAGIADRDLHFHDLRGTAATKFYIAGLRSA